MPYALVSFVEDAGVFAVQPVHPFRKRSERRLDDQMVVIRHQAIFVETPAKPLDGRREQGKEQDTIVILPEDVLQFIASGCDVPEGTFELKSQRS